jgi:hypothetical protein
MDVDTGQLGSIANLVTAHRDVALGVAVDLDTHVSGARHSKLAVQGRTAGFEQDRETKPLGRTPNRSIFTSKSS